MSEERFDRIDEKLDRIEARLDRLEHGQEALRADMSELRAGQQELRHHMGVLHEEVLDRIQALRDLQCNLNSRLS